MQNISYQMFDFLKLLFPICRSITGEGVVNTLKHIQNLVPELKICEVPSGTKAFDWTVPKEWNIKDAYIIDPNGKKIVDFKKNNLHILGYSIPVNKEMTLEELQENLYSLPEQPDAIPYVTSYYGERWGFCITENQRKTLQSGTYKVKIDSTLENGCLTYGEVILPGQSEQEIFLSTYVCHPSMANNELSGPVVTTYLLKWLKSLKNRKYTYRVIFIPETIGSIVYLSKNFREMKENIIAGFNVTCVGDDRAYSYLQSRNGKTLSDRVAQHVLSHIAPNYVKYSFLDRGGDECQYCSPGIDLPVVSMMRTKYRCYPEYHTSLDNLQVVSPSGLLGGYNALFKAIEILEKNDVFKLKVLCEPQYSKRGLLTTLSGVMKKSPSFKTMKHFTAYCDGQNDLLAIAEIINVPAWELFPIVEKLNKFDLLTKVNR
ncbi:aminopeptidase [Candidatus Magnetomorum sp. HK-1]|nr:aminopeptidase [Candidatus Magnetomorum sp. HK-1]